MSQPGIVLQTTNVTIGRQPEPARIGTQVGAYAYGLAAALSTNSAIAVTP